MAAIPIAKNAAFNLSKAFPRSNYPLLYGEVSRVCFTTATKHSGGQYAEHDDRRRDHGRDLYADKSDEDAAEMTKRARESVKESMGKTKERTQEMEEKAKEAAEKAKHRTESVAERAAEKAKEGKDWAADTAQETKEKAKDRADEMKEKTEDTAYEMKEKTKGTAETVAEKTKEGAYKVVETAETVGEKAKQTMKDAWGAAKETTQKIKETVVGKDDDDDKDRVEDFMEDHVRKPARKHRDIPVTEAPKGEHPDGVTMDEDVVELRRKAGQHDHHDKKH
nr:late embryogenesis abundant protein At3g53040-like [Coffea arabica]